MKMSFKHYPKLNNTQLQIVEELSYHTSKLYNIANYNCRTDGFKSYLKMNDMYNDNHHKNSLNSHTYQQCLKMVEQDWNSYFAAIKDYKKKPNKYNGVPRPPKFKNTKNKRNEVIFTDKGFRIKDEILKISLGKSIQSKFGVKFLEISLEKVYLPVNLDTIRQIKIAWNNSSKKWYINIIWEQAIINITNGFNNNMSIDLGLDNLATVTFEKNTDSYLIDGKYIKSKNSYYNKEIAKLTSVAMKQQGNPKYFKRTSRIIKLQQKRNDFVKDYIHKASRQIIKLALDNKCRNIIIGDFSGVKQNNKSKSFVQIPQQTFVDKIKYKAELIGIKVILINESYTSGCSALDLDIIGKSTYDKSRRIQRGLFRSNKGILINADVNGSYNIMRRFLKGTPTSLQEIMDNGRVASPIRLRVA